MPRVPTPPPKSRKPAPPPAPPHARDCVCDACHQRYLDTLKVSKRDLLEAWWDGYYNPAYPYNPAYASDYYGQTRLREAYSAGQLLAVVHEDAANISAKAFATRATRGKAKAKAKAKPKSRKRKAGA